MQQILDIMFRYFLNFVQLAYQFYEHNQVQMDGLVQERHNSNTNALEFRLSCTNSSTCAWLCS